MVQTDRLNRLQNVHSKTFQMIYDTPIKAGKQLATRKTIYLPRYTKGGGGIYNNKLSNGEVNRHLESHKIELIKSAHIQ